MTQPRSTFLTTTVFALLTSTVTASAGPADKPAPKKPVEATAPVPSKQYPYGSLMVNKKMLTIASQRKPALEDVTQVDWEALQKKIDAYTKEIDTYLKSITPNKIPALTPAQEDWLKTQKMYEIYFDLAHSSKDNGAKANSDVQRILKEAKTLDISAAQVNEFYKENESGIFDLAEIAAVRGSTAILKSLKAEGLQLNPHLLDVSSSHSIALFDLIVLQGMKRNAAEKLALSYKETMLQRIEETVKYLVTEGGLDPNKVNSYGFSILGDLVRQSPSNIFSSKNIAGILIEAGAKPQEAAVYGPTFPYIVKRGDVELKYGTPISARQIAEIYGTKPDFTALLPEERTAPFSYIERPLLHQNNLAADPLTTLSPSPEENIAPIHDVQIEAAASWGYIDTLDIYRSAIKPKHLHQIVTTVTISPRPEEIENFKKAAAHIFKKKILPVDAENNEGLTPLGTLIINNLVYTNQGSKIFLRFLLDNKADPKRVATYSPDFPFIVTKSGVELKKGDAISARQLAGMVGLARHNPGFIKLLPRENTTPLSIKEKPSSPEDSSNLGQPLKQPIAQSPQPR